MKMRKLLVMVAVVALVTVLGVCLFACNNGDVNNYVDNLSNLEAAETTIPAYSGAGADYSGLDLSTMKIGLICLHDSNSTYDKNFIDAMKQVQKDFNLTDDQVKIVTGIPEGDECYNKAVELANQGCKIIFADSFGHEAFLLKAAKEFPNVQFCHATGTTAHTENVKNFANAFASIYQGRYLAGVAAGLRIKQMIDNGVSVNGHKVTANSKIGYIGAYTYAEVISGYTSFFLGVRSVEGCENITMDVQFTGSWYDVSAENSAALNLINDGCILISQHADSMGAPNACEEYKVPNVSYNGSTFAACPDTFIISSRINWATYYKFAIAKVAKGEAVPYDYTATIADGGVQLTDLGTKAPVAGTAAKIIDVRNKLAKGEIKVFDCSKFTVEGKNLTEYKADVDTDADFTPDTNVIKTEGGVTYFDESTFRSAPYFDITIDGITLKNTKF